MEPWIEALRTRPGAAARWAAPVRFFSGVVFFVFGLGKFTNHATEVASFEDYGLPSPDLVVDAIGALEVLCGVLLILGLATRLAALLMAGNMVAAIALSGIGEGEVIPSLTLAPLLLAGMVLLCWTGPGRRSLDEAALERLGTATRIRRRRGSR